MPGLGGHIGRRQFAWAALVRREILGLTWLFLTAVGATILLWDHSFVALWGGPGQWAGPTLGLLIVLTAGQTALLRTHSHIIDAPLFPWRRVPVCPLAAALAVVG